MKVFLICFICFMVNLTAIYGKEATVEPTFNLLKIDYQTVPMENNFPLPSFEWYTSSIPDGFQSMGIYQMDRKTSKKVSPFLREKYFIYHPVK